MKPFFIRDYPNRNTERVSRSSRLLEIRDDKSLEQPSELINVPSFTTTAAIPPPAGGFTYGIAA